MFTRLSADRTSNFTLAGCQLRSINRRLCGCLVHPHVQYLMSKVQAVSLQLVELGSHLFREAACVKLDLLVAGCCHPLLLVQFQRRLVVEVMVVVIGDVKQVMMEIVVAMVVVVSEINSKVHNTTHTLSGGCKLND